MRKLKVITRNKIIKLMEVLNMNNTDISTNIKTSTEFLVGKSPHLTHQNQKYLS